MVGAQSTLGTPVVNLCVQCAIERPLCSTNSTIMRADQLNLIHIPSLTLTIPSIVSPYIMLLGMSEVMIVCTEYDPLHLIVVVGGKA